jgi:hypothetical protein
MTSGQAGGAPLTDRDDIGSNPLAFNFAHLARGIDNRARIRVRAHRNRRGRMQVGTNICDDILAERFAVVDDITPRDLMFDQLPSLR